jgi:hypothetical protein
VHVPAPLAKESTTKNNIGNSALVKKILIGVKKGKHSKLKVWISNHCETGFVMPEMRQECLWK